MRISTGPSLLCSGRWGSRTAIVTASRGARTRPRKTPDSAGIAACTLLFSLFLSCSEYQTFPNPEEAALESPKTYVRAEYELETNDGQPVGEVRVWPEGVKGTKRAGRNSTQVCVGFRLENMGSDTLVFAGDHLLLDAATSTGYSVRNVRTLDTLGALRISPGQVRELTVCFELPSEPEPNAVQAFRASWSVSEAGSNFAEITPFLREEPARSPAGDYRFFYSPTYDPFYDEAYLYRPITPREQPYKLEHHRPGSAKSGTSSRAAGP